MEPVINLGPEACCNLNSSLQLEWLETNGLGGFASSTVSGAHTRREHGLLVAFLPHLPRLMVLLSKLEETLRIGDESWELSTNVYRDVVHPRGYLLLKGFRLDPFPVLTFANEKFELQKTILMARGENTTLVQYQLVRAMAPARLEIRPLIAVRESGELTRENPYLDPGYRQYGNRILLQPYPGVPPFQIAFDGQAVRPTGAWYRKLHYAKDTGGGLVSHEDLFNPCVLDLELTRDRPAWVCGSTRIDEVYPETVAGLIELEDYRRRNLSFAGGTRARTSREETLLRAADQFVLRGEEGKVTVAPGYPRPQEGGGAALVSLTGLALVTGRWDEARRMLVGFARHCRNGRLPSRIPDPGEDPAYDSVETSLWFGHGAGRYLRYTGDLETVRTQFYPVLKQIIAAIRDGACGDTRLDSDGLLIRDETALRKSPRRPELELRVGKPVELQALWYHTLAVATFLAQTLEGSRGAREFSIMSRLCKRSFVPTFWNPAEACLFDSIRNGMPDPSIRPYQVMAVGLPDTMLSRSQQQAVVRCLQRNLLMPYGLRSLAPSDSEYRGLEHLKGTAQSWLVGPYASAFLAAFGRNPRTQEYVHSLLDPFWLHLSEAGLGSISESFDGDPPHAPRGYFADARGVAEVLRTYYETNRRR